MKSAEEIPTPRTTAIVVGMHEDVSVDGPTIENLNVFINHARQLERELADAYKQGVIDGIKKAANAIHPIGMRVDEWEDTKLLLTLATKIESGEVVV